MWIGLGTCKIGRRNAYAGGYSGGCLTARYQNGKQGDKDLEQREAGQVDLFQGVDDHK
jgi:hypothetical protein